MDVHTFSSDLVGVSRFGSSNAGTELFRTFGSEHRNALRTIRHLCLRSSELHKADKGGAHTKSARVGYSNCLKLPLNFFFCPERAHL